MSSGLRSDFLLVLTGQVGSGEGFLSGESMLPAEAVVRAHCAGRVPGLLLGKRVTDPHWGQRSRQEDLERGARGPGERVHPTEGAWPEAASTSQGRGSWASHPPENN